MKVKIGKYPSQLNCKIHENYMNEKYGELCNNKNKFEEFLEILEDSINKFYSFLNVFLTNRKQKINVRIDRQDTWNMDYTLSFIILPMLKQLKKAKHGSPFVDDEDVPEEIRSTSAPEVKEWETDKFFHNRWEFVLDEMIFAFEMKSQDDDIEYSEDNKEVFERMSNGFKLFGKYYESLWD